MQCPAGKLDGASETQQLEVLAALQTYGLVLGNDIAVTNLCSNFIQNRMLLRENVALKEQLSEQRSAREVSTS